MPFDLVPMLQKCYVYNVFNLAKGLADWEDAGLLAQVLAASQQEYLDKLKKSREAVDSLDETMDSPKQQQQEEPRSAEPSSRDTTKADPSSDLTTANGTNNS